MILDDFLTSCERNHAKRQRKAARKELLIRLTKFLGYATLVAIFGLGFCVFGWTAANVAPPVNDVNFPLPSWWWTASMITVALSSFVLMGAFLFKALDELLPTNDVRRIMR